MNEKERAFGRFETVLRLYWDGIPTPSLVIRPEDNRMRTFSFKLLGYTPDYYGTVDEVFLSNLEERQSDAVGFTPLCSLEKDGVSASSRIGSHFSPLVAQFVIKDPKRNRESVPFSDIERIRMPSEPCESSSTPDEDLLYHSYMRMIRLVDLYEPLIKEACPISQTSLRRIVVLGTRGTRGSLKKWVIREIGIVKDEYVNWIGQAILFYMCKDRVFQSLLAPLQIQTSRPSPRFTLFQYEPSSREAMKKYFHDSRKSISNSLLWNKGTRAYFLSLKTLWDTRFKDIVLFDVHASQWETKAVDFVEQLKSSLHAALTRIRIEFYSNVEDFFFTYIPDARNILTLTESEVKNSVFQKIFVATRVFFVNELRSLVFSDLENLLSVFQRGELRGSRITRTVAKKRPVYSVSMIIGDDFLPRSLEYSSFMVGISEIFEDLLMKVNSFPQPEFVILRTLNLKCENINVVSSTEIAVLHSYVVSVLDEIGGTVDEVTSLYSSFATLPAPGMEIAKNGSPEEIGEHLALLRSTLNDLRFYSPSVVYCGCILIHCESVKAKLEGIWSDFLQSFCSRMSQTVAQSIEACNQKCLECQKKLSVVPSTVSELERYFEDIKSAAKLIHEVREINCREIIGKFESMENFQIPIERELYTAALDMMKWPKVLSDASSKAEQAKEVCRPLLVDKLSSLRRETRDNIKTLMTGITELYNMFNLELCDIAAQTCSELRVIVDDINTTITSIIHQETSLGIPIDDTFEDFYPILNHFEIIEQYWSAIYKSVRVSAYYSASVSALNATEMIEEARKCRRLLHHATREVRAYPALVRLGKQKELALADFENLETLLDVLTTPGLKKNHWKDISRFLSARLGDDIHSILDRSVSLQKLLDADVLSHLSEISKIASLARSDYEVESSLEEMKSSSKRTYFQISTVKMTGGLSQSRISKSCYKSMLEQVEGYIFRCQCLFRRPELSGAVVSVLTEWEVSTEKARDVLLAYEVITDRWISMKGYFRYLKELEKDERLVAPEHQIVLEKLNHAEDAMNLLTATFKKPQFSLYTAIVQDTIVEQLLICKSAVEEAFELLSDSLEAKRRDFPRFFLLTDEQVQTILSPLNVEALMNLLPLMYPNLAKLKVEGGEIVAFIGDDGSYLKASKPLAICSQPIESFMIAFESTLKESLYQAVVSCTEAFRQMSTQVWVDSFFPQVLLLALRITHTRDLREVLSFGGACALSDYLNKVEDMHNEFCRISALGEGNLLGKTQATSVIFYTQHMISEIRHAIESGITTVTELDMTGMIQTFLDEGGIVTRTLGVNIPYGFEFLGGHGSPFISTEIVEKASTVLLSFAFRGSSPLICGTSAVQSNVLDCVCSFIGRLQICVPCFDELDISKMRTLLRASAQIGAVLFLHNSQFLKNAHVHNLLELCSTKIQEALSSGKDHPVVTLPLGPGGSGIDVFVDTGFHLVLGSDKSESLPETVRLRYRPVHVDPIRLQDVAWTFVYANGLHLGELNLRSAVYEAVSTFVLFNELQPSIFTAKGLLEVLRRAILSCEVADDFTRAFCDSCWSSFSFIFDTQPDLCSLFRWHIEHTLGIDGYVFPVVDENSDPFERFCEVITSNDRVVIVGGPFAGKSKLAKAWIGKAKHSIISPSLMTCDDLYGTESKIGLLQNMLNDSTKESEFYLLVECGRNIPAECMNWPLSTLFGVNRRLIVTTQQLTQASPRWASDVVFFHLESGNNWKLFLSHCLEGCFLGDTVFSVMEVVLPAVFDCLSPFARDVDSEDSEISYCDEFLAACQLSVSLYSKWCGFVDQVSFPDINLNDEGMHEDNLFALQCAVFAVCWALGWQAQPDLQMNVQHTLLELEKDLQQIASSFNSPDKVLPPCGEGDPSIFSLLCTRYGWKTFEEAEKLGFPRRWSTFKHVHPTTHGWSQFFPLPSRSLRLSAAEYLLDCGQSVWLQGDSVSGKTFLLQSIRHCERWVPLYMSGSKSFSASSAQENILDRIYLRSTHQYGPTVGKKLIVSIDDVHLTTGALGGDGLLSPTAGVAGALVAFITKHSTICIPRLGLTPITDTAFLLSSNEVSNIDLAVRRSVVNFLLPAFEGEELFEGVQRLFEVTCARKRLASFPEQWAEVIAKAHFLFVRAAYPSQREELTVDPLASTIGQPAFQHIEKLMSCEVRDLFRVVDSVKQVLLSPLTDAQVFETGAVTVFNYYASALNQNNVTDEEIEKMKEEFGTAASNVLLEGKAKEGEGPVRKALKLKSNTNFSVDTATDADKETVAEWIVELEVAHERIIEEPLQNLYSKGGERVDADGNSASSVILTDDTTIISSITATKNTATDAVKPSALEVEKDRVQRQRSRASSLFQKRQSAAYSSRTGSIVSEEKLPPPKSPLSPTRLTTWLTIHAKQLVSAGRASVQQHRIIASESDFGIRRLLRIVSCALHFPLVLLQNNHDGVETFKKEMTALIRLALSTDTRIMVYVPKDLLLVPQVAEMIDKIMRVGDAGDMFSHPERFTLSKGYQLSQQRSLRAQILLDDYELRPRVRRCFFFVLHTESATTKNSLSPLYPGFDAVPVVELYPPCLEEKLYRELAKGVLLGNQPSGSDPAWESEVSSALKGEKMVDAVCSVFQCVKTRFPDTTTDLLITYSLLLKNLLTNVLSTIKTQTSQVETVLRRGDEASTQLKKDSAALKELGTDLVNLKKRMAAQETCLAEDEEAERVFIEKAQKEEEQLKTEEQEIFNAEADVTEKERQSTENLEAARSSLRRVKLTHIRSMSSMRVIEKGSLLIKGIYKVLGEDVPKHNNSPSELWNIGVKMICSQEFVKRFIAVSPDTIEDINTYLPIQQDLSEVRYNNASPFAQALSEYVIAFIEHARKRLEIFAPARDSIAKRKQAKEEHEQSIRELYEKIEVMRDVKLQSRNKVAQHKEAIQDLINRQNLLTERGKRLTNYVGLVDRFTSFVDVETVKRQAEVNATAEGEVLLVAAFYTLISFRHNRKTVDATVLDMLAALKEMNVETPNNIYEDAIPLLYLSHAKQTDAFLPSAFPFRHQMCLLAISERLSNRWLLIGGSCPLFEKFVTIFLKTQCTGVTSISASIPPRQLKTQLLQSMQNGEGVILHGMHSEEHFQLIEHLGELAEKLNEQRRRRDLETKISFRVFDKVVEVHPRFYLVCLSPSLYLSGESSHLHYDSVYLDEPIPDSFVLDSVIIHNLPSADQKKDVKDEILQRKIHLCEEVAALRRVHGEACAKLSGDLDLVAEKGDDLLEEAERLINDVDYEDTQLTQLTMQIQNLKKKQWEMWGALKPALGGIMESLQFIEMSKFGRPWSNALLEPYFSVLTRLTKPLASRISPQSLSDLSVEHQCFYILLNYMERLGEAFANGWPSILRGWFSLVFCAGAVLRTDILTAQRGVLYSSEVELLTETQYKMMCQLVTSDDYAALYNKGDVSQLKELMVEAYKQSGDDLLVQLANQFSSGDQPATESEIGELFLAVLNLNFAEAEERAKSLYSTFFRSVKDAKTVQMGLEQPFQSTIRDMFSERDHFANAVRGMGAGRAPLLPLHILHHGTEHCVPLHFPCSSILPVLITLKVQAAALKYVFHVRTVTCTEDLHEIRRVLVRLSGGEDRAKGTFLCIHLDIPPASLQEETPLTHFSLLVQGLIELYLLQRTKEEKNTLQLCFFYTPSFEPVMQRTAAAGCAASLSRGYYVCLEHITPQDHLKFLLDNTNISEWEVSTKGGSATTRLRAEVESARGAPEKKSTEQKTVSLAQASTLLVKEILVSYVGVAERRRYLRRVWNEMNNGPECPDAINVSGVSDMVLYDLLNTVKSWVGTHMKKMEAYQVKAKVQRKKEPEGHRTDDSNSSGTILREGHVDAMMQAMLAQSRSSPLYTRGRVAQCYHRSHNEAWRCLFRSDTHTPLAELDVQFLSNSEVKVEEVAGKVENHFKGLLFNFFKKFIYRALTIGTQSFLSKESLIKILEETVKSPAVSESVTCTLTATSNVGALMLPTDGNMTDFRAAITEVSDPLVELCGDATVLPAYEATRQRDTARFLLTVRPACEHVEIPVVETDSAIRRRGAPGSLDASRLEQPLAALLDRAATYLPNPEEEEEGKEPTSAEELLLRLIYPDLRTVAQEVASDAPALPHVLDMTRYLLQAVEEHTTAAGGCKLWLPCLRVPQTTLTLFTDRGDVQLPSVTGTRRALVIVLAERRHLAACDVELTGAKLSPSVRRALEACQLLKDELVVAVRQVLLQPAGRRELARRSTTPEFGYTVEGSGVYTNYFGEDGDTLNVFLDDDGTYTQVTPPAALHDAFAWKVTDLYTSTESSRRTSGTSAGDMAFRPQESMDAGENVFVTAVDDEAFHSVTQRGQWGNPKEGNDCRFHFLRLPVPLHVRSMWSVVNHTKVLTDATTWDTVGLFPVCVKAAMDPKTEAQLAAFPPPGTVDYFISIGQ